MHHGCYRKYCFPPSRVIWWKLDFKNCSYSASCVATMASFLIYVLNKWHIYLYFVIAYYLYLLTLKCFKTFIVTERCSLLRLFSIRFWMRFSDATQSSSVAKTFLHLSFFYCVLPRGHTWWVLYHGQYHACNRFRRSNSGVSKFGPSSLVLWALVHRYVFIVKRWRKCILIQTTCSWHRLPRMYIVLSRKETNRYIFIETPCAQLNEVETA